MAMKHGDVRDSMSRNLSRLLAVAAMLAGCALQPTSNSTLLETVWRPVEIEGKPVVIRPGTREPYVMLSAKGNRASGYSGCNNFSGRFEQSGVTLRFGQLASTRMACMPESDLEARFHSALAGTASFRISGESLELIDQAGKARMRLEARHPG